MYVSTFRRSRACRQNAAGETPAQRAAPSPRRWAAPRALIRAQWVGSQGGLAAARWRHGLCGGPAPAHDALHRRLVALLRPARRFGHDDLVHPQHRHRRIGRLPQRLLLRPQQVEHTGRRVHLPVDHVHAGGALARLVRGVQRRDDVGRVEAGILCERARHHFQREAVLVDRVLVEAGLRLGVLLQQIGELKLAPARAGDKARVARHRLDGVDAVVDGALDVVHDVGRRAAHHDGGHLRSGVLLLEDGAVGRADLLEVDARAAADVVRRGRLEAHQVGGARGAADAAQLKLGGALEDEDAELFAKVERELADGLAAHDEVDARVADRLDRLLQRGLLRVVVVLEVGRRLEQHGPLRLGRRRVEWDAVDRHARALHLLDGAERGAGEAHPAHDRGAQHRRAQDLGDADVVRVELGRVCGHGDGARLGDLRREELLVPPLLGRDHGAERGGELRRVVQHRRRRRVRDE
mmetsp:Transcript_28425/g.83400  ORF Transcript_28425/g.83400 Transcript_28425/m.83400 type:complete len:466 (+) Transcript_28425:230-1627(+)